MLYLVLIWLVIEMLPIAYRFKFVNENGIPHKVRSIHAKPALYNFWKIKWTIYIYVFYSKRKMRPVVCIAEIYRKKKSYTVKYKLPIR